MPRWCLVVALTPADQARAEQIAGTLERVCDLTRLSVAAGPGAIVLAAVGEPSCLVEDGAGIVLGHLFDAAGNDVVTAPAWSGISGARQFLARYWGSYVAVRVDADGLSVLRDPSGAEPCYTACVDGVRLLTGSVRPLVAANLVPRQFDWTVIARSLIAHDQRSTNTAIAGIEEILPGTLVRIAKREMRTHLAWSPWEIIARGSDESPGSLADIMDRCASAWARHYSRPLIEISGGLDSAIVAATLVPRSQRPALITFAPGPGDPVEIAFARSIAEYFDLPLEIARPEIGTIDLTRSNAYALPRPNARAFAQAADACSLAYAQRIGANAFASGGGGDDVFGYIRSVGPALDRRKIEGLGFGLLRTVDDIARMNRGTIWEAVFRIIRGALSSRDRPVGRVDYSFLRPDACLDPGSPPPGYRPPRDTGMPGKSAHVRAILSLPNYLEGHARADFAPVLFPLLAQPIVETCLSIPMWKWVEGGRNRSVVRAAFASRLPDCVVDRQSKGAFDGFCAALFDRNRAAILEMLCGGRLSRNGLLDEDAMLKALRAPSPKFDAISRILALVDVEAWIRNWEDVALDLLPRPGPTQAPPIVDTGRPFLAPGLSGH